MKYIIKKIFLSCVARHLKRKENVDVTIDKGRPKLDSKEQERKKFHDSFPYLAAEKKMSLFPKQVKTCRPSLFPLDIQLGELELKQTRV